MACLVNGTEWVHILWPIKFCPKAGANLFPLTCKRSQGSRISSTHPNNIVVKTLNGGIILDCQIKARNSWVAGVKFLCKAHDEMAVFATALPKKNVSNLYIELSHPSKTITLATTKALGIQISVPSNHVKIVPWLRPSNMQ